jgi:hypothetical protein
VPRTWPLWHAEEKIINVRLGLPQGKPGRYAVASVRILRVDTTEGARADSDFAADSGGWSVSGGAVETTPAGLRARLDGPFARRLSPLLAVDAGVAPYVVLEVTTPPHAGAELPAPLELVVHSLRVASRPPSPGSS